MSELWSLWFSFSQRISWSPSIGLCGCWCYIFCFYQHYAGWIDRYVVFSTPLQVCFVKLMLILCHYKWFPHHKTLLILMLKALVDSSPWCYSDLSLHKVLKGHTRHVYKMWNNFGIKNLTYFMQITTELMECLGIVVSFTLVIGDPKSNWKWNIDASTYSTKCTGFYQ